MERQRSVKRRRRNDSLRFSGSPRRHFLVCNAKRHAAPPKMENFRRKRAGRLLSSCRKFREYFGKIFRLLCRRLGLWIQCENVSFLLLVWRPLDGTPTFRSGRQGVATKVTRHQFFPQVRKQKPQAFLTDTSFCRCSSSHNYKRKTRFQRHQFFPQLRKQKTPHEFKRHQFLSLFPIALL